MRRSAGQLTALVLLAGMGCARAEVPGASPERVVRVDEEGRPMIVVRGLGAVEVTPGAVIDLVVTRPVAIPAQFQFAWPARPEIQGEAVRFLRARVEAPPPDVDGGVTTHHYELEAVAPGKARVSLVPVPAGPEAVQAPVHVDVTVRDASPLHDHLALPELLRRLVELVATSSGSPLEIARGFGEVETDSDSGVYVKPSDPRLKRVIVVKHPETRGLGSVQLQFAVPGSVARAGLEALWGPAQVPPALAIETRTLVFRPSPPPGARFQATVALVVEGDEHGPAIWAHVIRDPL